MFIELCLKPMEAQLENGEARPADQEDLEEGAEKLGKAGVTNSLESE